MKYLISIALLLWISNAGNSQQIPESRKDIMQDASAGKTDTIAKGNGRILIENKGKRIIEVHEEGQVQYFYDQVRGVQDSTYFFADSAILSSEYLIATSNVVILQDDTIQLYSDSLYYSIDSSSLELYGKVIFNNGEQSLASEKIFYHLRDKIAYYQDTAILSRGDDRLQSIVGRYEVEEKKSYFYEKVIFQGIDVRMRTDSLLFLTDENKIIFLAPTRIKTSKAEIYCESGYYLLKEESGVFETNAQYVSESQKVTGKKLIYNHQTGEVTFDGNTEFLTDDGRGTGELLNYIESSGDLILEGNAYYITEDKTLSGVRITYNDSLGDLSIAGDAFYKEGKNTINAENIEFNEKTETGLAEGEVIWEDTTSHSKVRSDILEIESQTSKAYNYVGKPEIEMLLDQDTMYMTSDTLRSIELTDTSGNTSKKIIGDNRVKIYKADMQAIADSSVYYVSDSIYGLYGNPMIWFDSTQFYADTILLFLKNNKLHRMELIQNAMVLNTSDAFYFNQIKGREIEAFFLENELDRFMVDGNAQSIYYVLDEEDAYVGVNTTECSRLKFYFGNNVISDIKGYTDVKQKMIPMKKADHEGLKLAGFKWALESKPKNREDLQL